VAEERELKSLLSLLPKVIEKIKSVLVGQERVPHIESLKDCMLLYIEGILRKAYTHGKD